MTADTPRLALRLILQDWPKRSIKQWSELKMGSVKMTTVRVIDEFVSVTIPSLPAITDLQLALKHLVAVYSGGDNIFL